MPSKVYCQDSCGVQDALGSLSRQTSKLLSTGSPVQLQRNQQLPEQLHFADVGGAKARDTAATSRLRLTAYAVCGQDAVQLAHWRVHVKEDALRTARLLRKSTNAAS